MSELSYARCWAQDVVGEMNHDYKEIWPLIGCCDGCRATIMCQIKKAPYLCPMRCRQIFLSTCRNGRPKL